MPKVLQLRRDTTLALATVTVAEGELMVDTDKKTVVVGDGVTPGGFPLAKQTDVPSDISELTDTNNLLGDVNTDLVFGNSVARSVQQITTARVLVNDNGVLKCNQIPVREMGVCTFNLLFQYLRDGTGDFLTELPKIAQEGIRFIRVNSCGLFAPEWTQAYVNNKALFLKRTRQFLDVAKDNNIGVVMNLFWRYATIPDLVNERVNTGLATEGSLTRNFCATYIEEVVGAFKDHPAVSAWEVGNEYSLFAANGALPHINVGRGTPASYTAPADVMTLETMRSFYVFVQTEIKKYDTSDRIIMSGNGGPGGVIEKSLENYISLLALDNPMDTWSIHKYARNNFGSRAYADSKSTLIEIRNAAFAANKPFILGEFGQERNEVYGGYGGLSVFKTGADAVYRSGIQLAFAWEWLREDRTTVANDFAFHPENTINGTDKVFNVFKEYNDLMKAEGYIPPNTLMPTAPMTRTGQVAYGTGTTVTIPDHVSLNQSTGFCVSILVKKSRDDLSNRKIMFKYGTNSGWFIGYGTSQPDNGGNVIYAQVQWSDGSSTSTNNQTLPQNVDDGLVNYIFQLNETNAEATGGLTVYQNGIWVNTIPVPAGKSFNPSTGVNLTLFAEPSAGSAAHVGLCQVKLFNRALTDVEARNVYLYNISPIGALVSEWELDGNLNDSVGTNHGTLTSGTITYAAN